jgi:hypothetical protein
LLNVVRKLSGASGLISPACEGQVDFAAAAGKPLAAKTPLLRWFVASVVALAVLPVHELTATALCSGPGSVGGPTLD